MRNDTSIDFVDLLRRREAEFVTVWKCEQEVRRVLGIQDFPFSPPPELPSRRKISRPSVKKHGGESTEEISHGRKEIRKLRPDTETAYRIEYINGGVTENSYQVDRDLVMTLLAVSGGDFRVVKVETVFFKGVEDWKSVEVLWKDDTSMQD